MTEFKFSCPHCNQPLEAPDELLGQTIECPSCSGAIQLPSPESETPPDASPPPQKKIIVTRRSKVPDRNRPCPYCGETILAVAKKCKHCGEWVSGDLTMGGPARGMPIKVVSRWTIPFSLLFTLNIYYFFWVYRVVRELNERRCTDLSPGKAVGLLFIPFFNFVWHFVLWAQIAHAVPNLCARAGLPRPKIRMEAPFGSLLGLLDFAVPGLGFFFVTLFFCSNLCTVQGHMNRIAQAKGRA